jgi:hypothetical protein
MGLPGSRSPGLGTYVQHTNGPPTGPWTYGWWWAARDTYDGARRSWIEGSG